MERKKAGKRKAEVGGLFAKLYGDWAAGRVMEYNFNMLTPKYQTVQGKLAEKIDTLTVELRAYPRIRRVQIAPSAFFVKGSQTRRQSFVDCWGFWCSMAQNLQARCVRINLR